MKEGVKMNIKIMSRKRVEQFCEKAMEQQTALISITDYDNSFAVIKNPPQYLLQLAFNDVPVGDGFFEEMGRQLSQKEVANLEERYHSITHSQVSQIVDFYNAIKDKAQLLILQCEHGQSRSAAIAAAIMEYETANGIDIFANDWYCPNKSIFRKVLSALKTASR